MRLPITTRMLLGAGIVGPVGFVLAFFAIGASRPGYSPVRHFVSLLSLGDQGWLEVLDFLVGGLLIVAFGIGLGRRWTVAGASRWAPRLVTIVGLALAWCGIFSADPALGFPQGAPAGIPTDASWHGALHYLGAIGVFLGLPAAMAISARRGPTAAVRAWATYSLASAALMLAGWLAGFLVIGPSGIVETAGLWQRIAIVAGSQWLVVTAGLELARAGAAMGVASARSI